MNQNEINSETPLTGPKETLTQEPSPVPSGRNPGGYLKRLGGSGPPIKSFFDSREGLFKLQSIIALFSVLMMLVMLHRQITDTLKAVMTPFGPVSLLLFLLFVVLKVIMDFHEDVFKALEKLKSVGILGVTLLAVFGMLHFVGKSDTFETLWFFAFSLLSLLAFINLRVKNLWTMALVTGMAEGIIVYIVFIP